MRQLITGSVDGVTMRMRTGAAVKLATHKFVRRAQFVGVRRYCACCQSYLRCFTPYPHPPRAGRTTRADALCPVCGALERHRLAVKYLKTRTTLWDGRPKRLLHIAPERQLSALLARAPGVTYISVDLTSKRAMVHADITKLSFADHNFDVIYCSHVLEHVPDDAAAMRELRRVLRPSGWAILQVPVLRDVTFEDASITTPQARLAAFGQHDHVRIYGKDYVERLRAAGFEVIVDSFAAEVPEALRRRWAIVASESIYLCRPLNGVIE